MDRKRRCLAMFPCCSQRVTRPLFLGVFLLVSASPHRGIREQRAMALLGLGRQSAIDLALDEWAAVAEALRYGRPSVTNHSYICDIKVCVRIFIGRI